MKTMKIEKIEWCINEGKALEMVRTHKVSIQTVLHVAAHMCRNESLDLLRAFRLIDFVSPMIHFGPIMSALEMGIDQDNVSNIEDLAGHDILTASCERCNECFYSEIEDIIEKMNRTEFCSYLQYLDKTKEIKKCTVAPILRHAYRLKIIPRDILLTAILEGGTVEAKIISKKQYLPLEMEVIYFDVKAGDQITLMLDELEEMLTPEKEKDDVD